MSNQLLKTGVMIRQKSAASELVGVLPSCSLAASEFTNAEDLIS